MSSDLRNFVCTIRSLFGCGENGWLIKICEAHVILELG